MVPEPYLADARRQCGLARPVAHSQAAPCVESPPVPQGAVARALPLLCPCSCPEQTSNLVLDFLYLAGDASV